MRFSAALVVLCLGVIGCSQHFSSSSLPVVPQQAALREAPMAGTFKTLYSFRGDPDGSSPWAGPVVLNGTLYGTTLYGGKDQFGVVYKVATSGGEHVIHMFPGSPDGGDPYGRLIVLSGLLYGTAYYGGNDGGYGSVYKISSSGTEHVVCGFKGDPQPQFPYAGVIAVGGALYGTTYEGGKRDFGTVYKCSMSGAVSVLHSFSNTPDGVYPYARLAVLGGTLYGATYQGGKNGYGEVFKITTGGAYHILHSFADNASDGGYPYAGLTAYNGALYGTTVSGGAYGNGTVYKITPSGAEHVIYSFKGDPDGSNPYCDLLAVNGTLYGTTENGGTSNLGAVFKVSLSGKEQLLHSFTGVSPDGANPIGGLAFLKGTLYGTTVYGGKSNQGTVFKISP